MKQGKLTRTEQSKLIEIDKIICYISNKEDDPTPRLYVPKHLRDTVMIDFHDNNGHTATQKLFLSLKQQYYWPNLFQDISYYVAKCVSCQCRNLRAQNPPLQETSSSPYPFAYCEYRLLRSV